MADITVTYLDHMGSDLTVVNAARVSFDRKVAHISDDDRRLIRYLSLNGHFAPFTHPQLSIHVKAPIFVARQLVKHRVGLSQVWEAEEFDDMAWSEVSRRYVKKGPEFWDPKVLRKAAANVKQGSSSEPVEDYTDLLSSYKFIASDSKNEYEFLLKEGVCPEQARAVLPLTTMTEWHWTGSLFAFARIVNLRINNHAQAECRAVARQISAIIYTYFPISHEALI